MFHAEPSNTFTPFASRLQIFWVINQLTAAVDNVVSVCACSAISVSIGQFGASTSPPSQQQQQQQQLASPDSDGGGPTDWCLPHFVDDCPGQRGSNLLFGCLSAANGAVLKNAFVIVQFNQFQQIIGVYTLQAPSDSCKVNMKQPDFSFVVV
jgi:hypothetical protein